ncbi:ATP-grasp domain-containing protein [Streptomyces sp. NPDC059828]|uniref:ATP-grasp domain-containing protein n=1 Tax=Streptomyces sp. NPDC059828 TaxID=3346965 RepID=UPI00366355D6
MDERGFLAVAPQYTTTRELLSAAAQRRGMRVEVLPVHGDAGTEPGKGGGHYYGGPAFAARVVDGLGVALLEPSDEWLATLPHEYTGRRIALATLREARSLTGPAFIKPPSDKSFPAAVYGNSGSSLAELPELPPEVPVLVSEVVTWAAEFRLHVLDGEVRTGSQYATYGRLDARPLAGHRHEDAVMEFAGALLATAGGGLPSAVVVDVGLLAAPADRAPGQWAVVEANMAWFSNCYAADPDRVLDVVLRSAGPRARVAGQDLRFCRRSRTSAPLL